MLHTDQLQPRYRHQRFLIIRVWTSHRKCGKINRSQECIPVGCVPSAAVAVWRGGGGGVSAQGRVCPGVGCLPGGCIPACRCKNITFPQLRLRTVTMSHLFMSYVGGVKTSHQHWSGEHLVAESRYCKL